MERGWKPNIEISPACPRCGSSNTKFCYYNNYSLTQPRYFCKGCRRYWTKGGSLRNVPVGGGCRKTRRGKSVRAAVDAAARNNSPRANRIQSSISAGASTSIDLAAVYANFLNQPPPPQQQQQNHVSDGFVIPSIEFSDFHLNHLSSDLAQPQESGFFESFPIRFSETHLFGNGGGNSTYFDAAAVGNIGVSSHDVLPPLPAAEVSEGVIWPSSEMILHNHMVPGAAAEGVEPPLHNSELFSGLNLEAIFRS